MGVNEPQQPAEFLPHVMLNSIQHLEHEDFDGNIFR